MERWKGKVAVVSGASEGIGAAIVKALLAQGLTVSKILQKKNITPFLNLQPQFLHDFLRL